MLYRVSLLSLLVLLLALPSSTRAQQGRWQSLQEIQTGQKITVVDRQMKTYNGQFVRYTDTDLTVKVDGQPVMIERDNVVRVTTSGGHRGRNALIGLLAGAAAGGVVAGTALERETGYGGAAAGAVAGFAGVGAGVGALIPGSRTVYRAEEKKQAALAPSTGHPPPAHAN